MKKKQEYVDRAYKLVRNEAPLSYMLPSRHTRRSPLLYFDEDSGTQRAMRYASNQRSVFEDEQDSNAILEPIIFEDGMLTVGKENQTLQKFLHIHPLYNKKFVEIDKEKDASVEVDIINAEAQALTIATSLTIDQLEMLTRGLFGKDPSVITTAEMKRDVLVFAKTNPTDFNQAMEDPTMKFKSEIQTFFDQRMILSRNKGRDVFFNLEGNKKRMLTVEFGRTVEDACAEYFKTEDGKEVFSMLNNLL